MATTLGNGNTVTLRQANREWSAKVIDIEWMVDRDGLYRQTVQLLLFDDPPHLTMPPVTLTAGDGLLPLVGWVCATQRPGWLGASPELHKAWVSLCPCSWLPFEDLLLEDMAWLAEQQRLATCLGEHEPIS